MLSRLAISLIDGSFFALSKNLSKDGCSLNSNNESVKLLIGGVFDCSKEMLTNVEINKENSEHAVFLEQLPTIEKGKTFIFDRLYFCDKILKAVINHGSNGVFRLRSHDKFVKKFEKSKKNDKIIYLLNGKQVDKQTPNCIPFRLLKYTIDDNLFIIGTTLTNKRKFPFSLIKMLYSMRWDIEEFYKILNSDLNLKESRAKTLGIFQQELYAKLIIIVISLIFKKLILKYTEKKLEPNKHINFKLCMQETATRFLQSLLYDSDETIMFNNIIAGCQLLRGNIVTYEQGRKFERCAVRSVFKWYYLGPKAKTKKIKANDKKNEKKGKNNNKNAALNKTPD